MIRSAAYPISTTATLPARSWPSTVLGPRDARPPRFQQDRHQRPDAQLQSGVRRRKSIRTTVWISSAAWSISVGQISAGSATLAEIGHGYDQAGSRLWREDYWSKNQNPSTPVYLDELYTYDGVDRLTNRQRGELAEDSNSQKIIQNKNFAEEWTLDALGNWMNFNQDTNGDNTWEFEQGRTHTVANEILTLAGSSANVLHDAAGNMITVPKPSDWSSHYHLTWDAWNRLVNVFDADGTTPIAAYAYDGRNRRIVKMTYSSGTLSETRHFYYNDKWQLLEERLASGSTLSSSADRQNVWGGGTSTT